MDPIQLLDLTKEELQLLLLEWGEPRYRADQIWSWLYRHFAATPEDMTDLPRSLRTRLATDTSQDPLNLVTTLDSSDGQTRKTLFALTPDGAQIEAVLMRYQKRRTLLPARGDSRVTWQPAKLWLKCSSTPARWPRGISGSPTSY
jgi:23S rRNA (adenine2503-C2)-methyltransferase